MYPCPFVTAPQSSGTSPFSQSSRHGIQNHPHWHCAARHESARRSWSWMNRLRSAAKLHSADASSAAPHCWAARMHDGMPGAHAPRRGSCRGQRFALSRDRRTTAVHEPMRADRPLRDVRLRSILYCEARRRRPAPRRVRQHGISPKKNERLICAGRKLLQRPLVADVPKQNSRAWPKLKEVSR